MSNRDKVIAAAEEAGIYRLYDGISYGPSGLSSEQFERFYAIAFEAGHQAEREECIGIVETYRVSVGNSRSGELACEWTMENLREIRDEIRERSTK